MGTMFEPQGRAGKGVRCFGFLKNGVNGSCIAASACVSGTHFITVLMTGGVMNPLSTEDLVCQDLPDKGKPVVMAVMDEVVTDLIVS